MQIYTTTLTSGSLTINASDGVTMVSVQAGSTSSFSVQGTLSFRGNAPTAVTRDAGDGFNLYANVNSPINGLIITWISGSVDVVLGF